MPADLNTYGRGEARASLYEKLACVLYDSIRQVQAVSAEHAPDSAAVCGPEENISVGNQLFLRSRNRPQPVTVVCIADTLGRKLGSLPKGDVLLHAGNLTTHGTFDEFQEQLDWLNAQPHKHKVVIAGSRDLLMDKYFVQDNLHLGLDRPGEKNLNWGGVHYLLNEGLNLGVPERGRTLRIWGSPCTPQVSDPTRQHHRAFQYPRPIDCKDAYWHRRIPMGADIALLHCPPKAHVDGGGLGSESLLAELHRVKPPVVVCGHVHEGRGEETLRWDGPQGWYEGIALGHLNPWLSAVKMLWYLLVLLVKLLLGVEPKRETRSVTHIVNASVACGRRNVERRDAITMVI